MVATLVLVLLMLAFGLLVLGERMGLAAPLGAFGVAGTLALAMLALGLASVTSRLPRFANGADEPGPGGFAFAGRSATILVMILAFAPQSAALLWCWPAFLAGFFLAHAGAGLSPLTSYAARLGRFLAGLAMLVMAAAFWPQLADHLAQATGWARRTLDLAVTALALVVLVPGGAIGLGRLQRVMLLVALMLAVVPFAIFSGLAALERGDALVLEAFAFIATRAAYPSLVAGHPEGLALALGLAGGMAARGFGVVRVLPASLGMVAGVLCAVALVGLYALSEVWLAKIVGQRIAGVAPAQWPLFVFEPPLQGWLQACGTAPVDPVGAARACAVRGAEVPLSGAQLGFLASLGPPALALANNLPILLGFLWGLLPVLLGGAGVLHLLHGGAVALSESVLFATINPTGLRSWRLAMARLTLIAWVFVVQGIALPRLVPPWGTLMPVLAALAAGGAMLMVLARLRLWHLARRAALPRPAGEGA